MRSAFARAYCIRFAYSATNAGREIVLVGATHTEQEAETDLVKTAAPISGMVLTAIGRALRIAAFAIYASPALVLMKVLLYFVAGRRASDAVIVTFVIVVVAFFALLNLYLLAFFVKWIMRPPAPHFAEAMLGEGVRTANAAVGGIVRASGTVVALEQDAMDPFVLRVFDTHATYQLVRLIEMRCFAVVPDEGPALVVHGAAPRVVGSGAQVASYVDALGSGSSAPALLDLDVSDAAGEAWMIREGDVVEISGCVAEIVPNARAFQLDGVSASLSRTTEEADPYRAAAVHTAVVLESRPRSRIVIRKT